jgi:hypothetical protein
MGNTSHQATDLGEDRSSGLASSPPASELASLARLLRHWSPSYLQPLFSSPFFLMATFKVINGYDHKSSKSEGVSSLKEMSNQ